MLSFALKQAIGGREDQEDACGVVYDDVPAVAVSSKVLAGSATTSLFVVVCDGMGGHVGGEVASQVAVKALLDSVAEWAGRGAEPTEVLQEGCARANDQIAAAVKANSELAGMGTTFVAVAIRDNTLHWVSVGDSHLLLFRNGKLAKLNEDHSMRPALARMVEKNILTQEEALEHPERNALRSVLMGEAVELVDVGHGGWPLQKNDILILASDGIDALAPSDFYRVTGRFWRRSPSYIAEKLVARAITSGGPQQDNTTVAVVMVR